MNRRGDIPAIVILVFLTLVLVGLTFFVIVTRSEKIREKAYLINLEDIYVKEGQINFYVEEAMKEAVEGSKTNGNFSRPDFIINFLAEISEYRDDEGEYVAAELRQAEKQINENQDKIRIEDNKVKADFEFIIEDKIVVREKEFLSASYTYKKTFEKEI